MMKKWLVLLVAGLALSAQTRTQGSERKDLQIANDIATAVNRYAQFTIFDDVSARVQDGRVTLEGKVTMPYKRDAIGKRASEVSGVREMNNRIGVLPVSRFDDVLRQQIARSIYGNSNFWEYATLPNPPIHIIVERGRVTLTGVVRSEVDRMLARSLATQFGAFSVTSKLKTDAEVRNAGEESD